MGYLSVLKLVLEIIGLYIRDDYIPQGGHSAHRYMGGLVLEVYKPPTNISSFSIRPKNISSAYILYPKMYMNVKQTVDN